jgi:hypothetical protein
MRQWNIGDGLYFCHFQYPQVGLPLVEPIKRIVIGAEVPRHPALPLNGSGEHPTECGTIDRSRMDAEANDPARVLIHDHKDPVGPHRSRFAPEQIHAPEAVFRVPQGKSTRKDHQSPAPAGSDGRESCELRLCRFGCGTPRRSVVRFGESPSWDYVASFRPPNG